MGIAAVSLAVSISSIIISTTLTVEGQKAQAKASREAAEARSKAATEAGLAQERALRRRNRIELAAQRLRLAGSGVQVTGSPLEVLASNAAEFEREAVEVRNEFGRVSALEISQARNARTIGQLGAAASAVRGVGSIAAEFAASSRAAA